MEVVIGAILVYAFGGLIVAGCGYLLEKWMKSK